jgi:hypothetical protein
LGKLGSKYLLKIKLKNIPIAYATVSLHWKKWVQKCNLRLPPTPPQKITTVATHLCAEKNSLPSPFIVCKSLLVDTQIGNSKFNF